MKWITVFLNCLIVVLLIAAGCSPAVEAPVEEAVYDPTESPTKTPQPTLAERLVIGTTRRFTNLDPADAWAVSEWEIMRNTMDTLLTHIPGTTELQPGLANSYDISEDGLAYTFHLHEGLEFPDGSMFTAHAVAWSINRVTRLEGGSSYLVSNFVDYVETIDDYTVRFVLREPCGAFPQLIATPPYAPVSPECYPEDELNPTITCGGIGPYRVVQFEPDEKVVLESNLDYYREAPLHPEIILQHYEDSAALRWALENGEIDIAWRDLNLNDYGDLAMDANFNIIQGPDFLIRFLSFNTTIPPFDDRRVRQAISWAVDRETIAYDVFHGTHQPLLSMVPDGIFSHMDAFPGRDLDKAVELLIEAGYGEAYPLVVDLWWTPEHYGPTESGMADALKQALEETGIIQVNLHSAQWANFVDMFMTGAMPAFLLGWSAEYLDPDNYTRWFAETEESQSMGIYYSNPGMDDLFSRGYNSIDSDERLGIYQEVQQLWTEDVPTIPLTQASLIALTPLWVSGVVLDPTGLLYYALIAKSIEAAAAVVPGANQVKFKVFSQNTMLLPGAAVALSQRVPCINNLVKEYNIIGLQEVFQEESQNKIVRYWHAQHGLKTDSVKLDKTILAQKVKVEDTDNPPHGPKIIDARPNDREVQIVVDKHFVMGPDQKDWDQDGGLLILSKYPILAASGFNFKNYGGWDGFANKGVIYARVQVGSKPEEYIHVFNTHLQAHTEPDDVAIRKKQLLEIQEFIRKAVGVGKKPDKPDGYPIIIMGDFNIIAGDPEYETMEKNLLIYQKDPFLVDAWPIDNAKKQPDYTWIGEDDKPSKEENSPFGTLGNTLADETEKRQRIDYIFYNEGTKKYLLKPVSMSLVPSKTDTLYCFDEDYFHEKDTCNEIYYEGKGLDFNSPWRRIYYHNIYYSGDLGNTISDELKTEFERWAEQARVRNYELSNDAVIRNVKSKDYWLVIDGKKIYVLRKQSGRLYFHQCGLGSYTVSDHLGLEMESVVTFISGD